MKREKFLKLLKTSSKFERLDLRGLDLSGFNLNGVSFKGSDLRNANFNGTTLEDVSFKYADLRGATFKNISIKGRCNLRGAKYVLNSSFVGLDDLHKIKFF